MHALRVANPFGWKCRGGEGPVNENFHRLEEVWMPLPKNIQPNKWKGKECMEAFQESSPMLRIHCYKTAEPLLRNGTVEHVACSTTPPSPQQTSSTRWPAGLA